MTSVWNVLGAVSVRSKIMGMILGLTLLLGLGVTWQVRRSMARTLGGELEQRGMSVARSLAARSADPILIHDTYALYRLLFDTVENGPDIRYAFIVDQRGGLLAHSFAGTSEGHSGEGFPRALLSANQVGGGDPPRQQVLSTNEGVIHDFAAPIFEGLAGTARIGLSEARLRATVDSVTRRMLLTTLAVAMIGLAAASLLTWVLTKPILDLVSVTRRVARGDLSHKATPLADDEIGLLAEAFNQMVDDLSVAQSESQAYNEELLRRNRDLAVLNAVPTTASDPSSLPALLRRALERVLDLLDLSAGWVVLTERDSEPLGLACAVGSPADIAPHELEAAMASCSCRQVLETRECVVVHPLPADCPLRQAEGTADRDKLCHVAVPLAVKSRVLGLFCILGDDPARFGPDDLRLLSAVGAQLAVAIENANLWGELKTKEAVRRQLLDKVIHAQEEERKRIARLLHDGTSQALTSLMVGLKVVEGAHTMEKMREQAEALHRSVAAMLADVRGLALELRPSMLDDMGLIPALERYTVDFSAKSGTTVDFHALGLDGVRLLPRVETALYRIVQEALANVARHADAGTASVVLERHGDKLRLIVEDDGRGFDAEVLLRSAPTEEKLGLYGMQERAEVAGGQMTLESRPGAGTTVFVEVPFNGNLVHNDERHTAVAGR